MSRPAAFWDTSALIPLCVKQPQSSLAKSLYESYDVLAWWATEVEIISGLTRLARMGEITRDQYLAGKELAGDIVKSWISAGNTPSIANDACTLLELYPLRAGDSLQLAAALEACEHKPQGYIFVTADQRLADCARQEGFSVELL